MKVEIWSDVVCPWCYIGKRRFEAALDGLDARCGEIQVIWRSFELDPGAATEPAQGLARELASKYGMTEEQAQDMMDQMTRAAAAEGLDFDFARARRGNTLDAHRLLHFAADAGLQGPLKERLLRAYFTEGRAIADRDELAALAEEVGLDAADAQGVLAGDRYVEAVRADEARARSLGIRGVPFFLVDGKFGISGAQSPELLRQALERAAAERPGAAAGD
jgi:predicted DsbA family dithiol-disulfide isomerase